MSTVPNTTSLPSLHATLRRCLSEWRLTEARGIAAEIGRYGDAAGWAGFGRDLEMVEAVRPVPVGLSGGVDWAVAVATSDAVTAVFFHVDGGEHPFLGGGVDYRGALELSVAAALAAGFRVVVVGAEVEGAETVHLPVAPARMMYDRVRANLAVARAIDGPLVFLDTDVVLNRGMVFEDGFDIGLTTRGEIGFWHMPVNEGVVLARSGEVAVRHFEMVLGIYDWLAGHDAVKARYAHDIRLWRGGQLSLAALIDWNCIDQERGGIRYRMLPGEVYNRTVRSGDDVETLRKCWAVHFKGVGAKGAMRQYVSRK